MVVSLGRMTAVLVCALALLPFAVWLYDQPLTPLQHTLVHDAVVVMLGFSLLCFVLGELSGNISQVDKLWSLLPPIYAWLLTVKAGYEPRMVLMSVVATIWGIRLTFNFARHGGYSWKFWSGNEDYRWAHVRQMPFMEHRLVWTAFHLGFICIYQNILLMALALPIALAADAPRPLGIFDWLLATAYLGFVLFETIADEQQQKFQNEKKRRLKAGEAVDGDYARGFITSGLWSRSRHPNYFAEQSLWILFFLFSVAATGRLNWTVAGCIMLMLIFQGSSKLGEKVQNHKYPDYPEYQRHTPRFLPRLF
jgi:steroid 5-alpha reductase family enzyme